MPTYKKNALSVAISRARKTQSKTAAALATCMLVAMPALSQEKENDIMLEEVIVTGTTSGGKTRLESSIAVSVADAVTIDRKAPVGIADALELVPGLWVEDSGGETSNNVAPRGLGGGAAFAFVAIQEDGLPVFYDGEIVDALQKQDITISRFEAVRGGTSGILTVNGAGALINFISRKGTEEPEGKIRLTVSDYNTMRSDFLYSGPLSDDWLVSLGGFYRSSDAVRDTGFTADHGGQFRINLTRKLEDGELTFRFKNVNDRNSFFLPIPLTGVDDPKSIDALDANYGTLLGPDNAKIVHKTPDGGLLNDLNEGFKASSSVFGVYFEQDLKNGWVFSNNGSYTDHALSINAMFNGGNSSLKSGSERLAESDVTAMLAQFPTAVRASLAYADTGELINNPDTFNGNGFVSILYPEYRKRNITQIANDTRFTFTNDKLNVTLGLMYFGVNMKRDMAVDSDVLTEVTNNPRRLDIVALDASDNVVAHLTDGGVLQHGSWYTNNNGDMKSYSFYTNAEYQVTDDLRVDGGFRHETVEFNHFRENRDSDVPLGNGTDNILGNDTIGQFGNGSFDHVNATFEETAWTIGFNYMITDEFAVYGRYSDAFQMPGLTYSHSYDKEPSNLVFTEFGLRYVSDTISATGTFFNTEFKNLRFGSLNLVTNQEETIDLHSLAHGLEFEVMWQALDYLRIDAGGVIQKTKIDNIPSTNVADNSVKNGNQAKRTPETQIRIVPTLTLNDVDVYVAVHYLGKRFSDLGNTLELPAYTTVDAGVVWNMTDNLELQVTGRNLTNEVGLTEGNPRSGFSEIDTENTFFARPILGRSYIAQLTYSF